MTPLERRRLRVRGTVQGVGFRPFVFRLATSLDLAGTVLNTADGVTIEVEGPSERVRELERRLVDDRPPLARIDGVTAEAIEPTHATDFRILESRAEGSAQALIPADIAVCAPCLSELRDASDRRHAYPFINCTDCGPRFTIIEGVPYDRARTTMREFVLCPRCRAEYEDPRTRRFHAEPNACPACGPRVWLADAEGHELACADPIREAARRLAAGEIIAVKGVGGFHLAALASRDDAVSRLRTRKQRDRQPFAVMAHDLASVRRFAALTPEEEAWIVAPERPIVLLPQRSPSPLSEALAPGNTTVGAMLPYTPLHHLLLGAVREAALGDLGALVMTSANPHGEPLVKDNAEALARLSAIADAFLLHDRGILARADDSVGFWCAGARRLVRRSRGYVPSPIALPVSGEPVLAVGGDLKNVFCLTRRDQAFLGPYVGDLEDAATAASFEESVAHVARLLAVRPGVIACDLHPDYVSTRIARALVEGMFEGARLVRVQHHHAHVLSCLAEHGELGPALGLALDGAGWGPDQTSWGCELLAVDGPGYQRVGHMKALPLPGGDRAVREPYRIAIGMLCDLGRADLVAAFAERWAEAPRETVKAVSRVTLAGRMVPRSSGLGRLFDGVSALAGLCTLSTYEGEAAITLEQAAGDEEGEPYPYELTDGATLVFDPGPMLASIADDLLGGAAVARVSARFHATVVEALAESVGRARRKTGLDLVALSGGASQNRRVLCGLVDRLARDGLTVLTQSQAPANDGGLALGQALAALISTARGA